MRRSWIRGEERGGLVPGAVDVLAHPVAGLVAAGYENHPIVSAFGCTGGGAGNEGRGPVFSCYWDDIFRGDFRSRSGCRRVDRGRDVGFRFLEPRVECCAIVTEGYLRLGEAKGR